MVRSHLYELMPETQEQRDWFPSLRISLRLDHTYTVFMAITKKTKPKKVAQESRCNFRRLRQ